MSQLEVGSVYNLEVEKEEEFGYFLTNGEDKVLLHHNEVSGNVEIGEHVDVFLYHDKQGRVTATMSIPEVQLGTYGWAEVVEVKAKLGAFVNIGISKDILVSTDNLPSFISCWPEIGDQLYVTLIHDHVGRLLGKPASEEAIFDYSIEATEDLHNKNISGRIYRVLSVGNAMISLEGYRSFIHESERLTELRLGQLVTGRVIGVKEDGTLNVSLLPRKQESLDEDALKLYEFMGNNKGAMPYWDKSQPEDIQLEFQMSKAAFKRALGKLMKEGKIYQENGWTYLKEEQ